MKTEAEVQENIAGSKANLQKNLDNHHMSCRSGFMTQDLADQYEKTRAYMHSLKEKNQLSLLMNIKLALLTQKNG